MKSPRHNTATFDEEPPDDTGCLEAYSQNGQRVFEVKPPSAGRLRRESAPAPVLLALFCAGLYATGWIPQTFGVIASFAFGVAFLSVALWLHGRRMCGLIICITADEEFLRFDTRDRGRQITIELRHQPYEMYCKNTGPLRWPLVAQELLIITSENRLEIGRYLSRDEIKYLGEAICQTTGWEIRTQLGIADYLARLAIISAIAIGGGFLLGPHVVEWDISPELWQGRFYAGFVCASIALFLIAVFDESRRRRAVPDGPATVNDDGNH